TRFSRDWSSDVCSSDLPEVGEALQRFARELEPDVIVASGDFTQRAREEQFREAREFLDRLPAVPLVVTPGNHDVPLYRVMERLQIGRASCRGRVKGAGV